MCLLSRCAGSRSLRRRGDVEVETDLDDSIDRGEDLRF